LGLCVGCDDAFGVNVCESRASERHTDLCSKQPNVLFGIFASIWCTVIS
jgi:hypothetical protein